MNINFITIYVKSFKGQNFCGSSLKLNMQGKLSQLRTMCFAANPETIHMHSSSVYGVLELEDSHFNMCAMAKETRIQN